MPNIVARPLSSANRKPKLLDQVRELFAENITASEQKLRISIGLSDTSSFTASSIRGRWALAKWSNS